MQRLKEGLGKAAMCLRSSVSKNGLIAISDVFKLLPRQMENGDLETLTTIVLKKATDTNTFLSESADVALNNMCDCCNEVKAFLAIQASSQSMKS